MSQLNIKKQKEKSKIKLYLSVFFILFLLISIFFPYLLTSMSPLKSNYEKILLSPNIENLFGTDQLGRDLFSRVIYGSKISLQVALFTSLISLIFGTIYGLIAGFSNRIIDEIMMKIVDIFYSIPDLLLISIFILFLGKGILGITIALSLLSWMRIARISRASTLEIKNLPFILNAKIYGFSKFHIMTKELLPNILGPLVVTFTFTIPSSILAESTLSFLGIGISPPNISWGLMASTGWEGLRSFPHLIIFPSLAIFLSTLTFYNIGNYLKSKVS